MTDLNRRRSGTEVEGLMRGNDIVPLTEIFELLANNRYLITDRFHKILWRQAQLAIEYARAQEGTDTLTKLGSEYMELEKSFDAAMNEVFGIDKITWETAK
jgi:hypothetical protein